MAQAGHARRAAIDIGTVSTRLLVADVSAGSVEPVIRTTVITHLGDGVAGSGRISGTSLERTVETVRGFRDDARKAGATD